MNQFCFRKVVKKPQKPTNMGQGFSMPNKPISIAKTNRNIPSLHRFANVQDHLFTFQLRKRPISEKTILSVILEEFDNLVKYNIEKIPIDKLSFPQYNNNKFLLNPESTLQKSISQDINTKDYEFDPKEDHKHLYLCRKFITSLNENIGLFKEMEVMQICCNYLTSLPYSIKNLSQLRLIVLSKNRLSEIPEEIGMCRDLREIDVSHNLLTSLPKSIAALKKLTVLQISYNKITNLPKSIGKMISLKTLNISYNPITLIPFEILKLPFIASINSEGCPFDFKTTYFKEVGDLTLLESSARHIIRNNCRIPKDLAPHTREYLLSVQECAFCGGPFIEHYYEVKDLHEHDGNIFPIEYKMCTKHYNSHSQRLTMLFGEEISTAPNRLIRDRMPSITELFEPNCLSEDQMKIAERAYDPGDGRISLICLSLWNTRFYKLFEKESKRDNFSLGWSTKLHGESWETLTDINK